MNINVTYIPQEQEIEVLGHDCDFDGHILEEVEFDDNTLEWDGNKYDLTARPTEYGLGCKYCDYQEIYEGDDYED